MKENDKRDLKVIYRFARNHCDEIGLNTVDTINCNYVRLEERLNKLEQLEKKDELLTKIKDILALNFSYQEIGIKIKRLFSEEKDE